MSGRVTKDKTKSPKVRKTAEPKSESATADASLVLLWLCYKNNGGKTVNFDKVGAALNVSPIAAKSRFRRLKERMDAVVEAMENPKNGKGETSPKEEKADSASQPAQQDAPDAGPMDLENDLTTDV